MHQPPCQGRKIGFNWLVLTQASMIAWSSMLTFLTTPIRDINLSVIKAVERHSITIVTVKTVGPRFCSEIVAASAIVDADTVCEPWMLNGLSCGSGRFKGGAAGGGGHHV